MERIKVSKNFYLDEFIDIHSYFKTENNGYNSLDKRLINIAQLLREKYGKSVLINTWHKVFEDLKNEISIDEIIKIVENNDYYKGIKVYKWSGTRTNRTLIGSKTSAHRLFKAIDPKGDEKELYEIVKNNAKTFHDLGVRRLENIEITKGWLHIDVLEKGVVKPNTIKVIDKTSVKEYILAM